MTGSASVYDFGKLWRSAIPGLRDMLALSPQPGLSRDALHVRGVLWGSFPRALLTVVATACVAIGAWLAGFVIEFYLDLWHRVRWAPVLFGLAVAARFRARIGAARIPSVDGAFRGAFGPVAAVAVGLVVVDSILLAALGARGPFAAGAGGAEIVVGILELGGSVVAGLTATAFVIAAFAYTGSYGWALVASVGAFVLFTFSVVLLDLLVLQLAPFSSFGRWLVDFVTGAVLPERTVELIDRVAFVSFYVGICTAVLGSLWWHAKTTFPRVLAGDDVEIIAALEAEQHR